MEPNRESSMQHPTLMELQLTQFQALRDGNAARVADCQAAIYRRVEEAQAAARISPAG